MSDSSGTSGASEHSSNEERVIRPDSPTMPPQYPQPRKRMRFNSPVASATPNPLPSPLLAPRRARPEDIPEPLRIRKPLPSLRGPPPALPIPPAPTKPRPLPPLPRPSPYTPYSSAPHVHHSATIGADFYTEEVHPAFRQVVEPVSASAAPRADQKAQRVLGMGEEVKPPVHVKQKTIKKIGGVLAAPFRRRPKARNGGNVTQKGPAVAAALEPIELRPQTYTQPRYIKNVPGASMIKQTSHLVSLPEETQLRLFDDLKELITDVTSEFLLKNYQKSRLTIRSLHRALVRSGRMESHDGMHPTRFRYDLRILHRLLEDNTDNLRFFKDNDNPWDVDWMIRAFGRTVNVLRARVCFNTNLAIVEVLEAVDRIVDMMALTVNQIEDFAKIKEYTEEAMRALEEAERKRA